MPLIDGVRTDDDSGYPQSIERLDAFFRPSIPPTFPIFAAYEQTAQNGPAIDRGHWDRRRLVVFDLPG